MPPPAKQQGLDFSRPIFGEGIITNAPPAEEEEDRKGGIDFSKPVLGEGIITNAPTRQQMIQEPRTDRLPIGAEDLQTPVAPLVEEGDMTLEEHMELTRRELSPTIPAWGMMGPQYPSIFSGEGPRPMAQEGMDRPPPMPLYRELQARKGELAKWRGALRKAAPGGVARAKAEADEQRGLWEKAMPMVGSIGGTVVGALTGGFLGNIPGAWVGARTGMAIGGGLGAAGGFAAGKEFSGQGPATSGEMMRELALGAVIPTVKVGRGIIKTAFGEGAKIGGASEIGQQFQSMLDEGHGLSMSPGMVIKRNMYAAGFGGILGGIAGRKIPKGVLKETSKEAARVLELQMEVLESRILKAQKLKGAKGKPRGEMLSWKMKHKQAKADYDFFLKNFDLFSDPAKLEKHGERAVRISQTLATGMKKQDYWQRLVRGIPGEEDIAEGVLMDAARATSVRSGTSAADDLAAAKAAFEADDISLAERLKGLKDAPDSVKTKFISKFHPLKVAEEKLRVAAGMTRKPKHDIAAKFETLEGSFGKARGDLMDFDRAVTDRVRKLKGGKKKTLLLRKPSFKENELDFNQYMFWHRTKDRLLSDKRARDKIVALEDEIKKVKKVPQETSRRFEAGAEFRVKEEDV